MLEVIIKKMNLTKYIHRSTKRIIFVINQEEEKEADATSELYQSGLSRARDVCQTETMFKIYNI